jgi:hypothetical protein
MTFTERPALQAQPGTFSAYIEGLFEPDAPELAFYHRYCRRGHFRYFIARRENRYLADWIFLLAMPMFEAVISAFEL